MNLPAAAPPTGLATGPLVHTTAGTIAVQDRASTTFLQDVFAAGDVVGPTYRRVIIAASSGGVAALDVPHFLASGEDTYAHTMRSAALD